MRSIKIYICSIFCLFCLHANAQTAFSIVQEMPNRHSKSLAIPSEGKQIIDINSNLQIHISKKGILEHAKKYDSFARDSVELSENLQKLIGILKYQQSILDATQIAVENNSILAEDGLNSLNEFLSDVLADTVLTDEVEQILKDYRPYKRENPNSIKAFYLFQRLEEDRFALQQELNRLTKNANLLFSLTAHRIDKSGGGQVHIENFDSLRNGQIFEVERWVTTFSEEDVALFNTYKSRAVELNEQIGDLRETYIQQLKAQILPSLECSKKLPENIEAAISNNVAGAKDKLLAFKENQLELILAFRDNLEQDILFWQPGAKINLLQNIQLLIKNARSAALELKLEVISDAQQDSDVLTVIECMEQLALDLERAKALATKLSDFKFDQIYLASEEITKDILAFRLDQVPETGFISLVESGGRRVAGDELKIRAVLRFPDKNQSKDVRPAITIQQQNLKMFLVGMRSVTKVGLVLAQPRSYQLPDSSSQFRFAPNASLLFKFGTKRNIRYNQFVDFGFGINVAMPDFSGDGIPEFSAGATITALKDILSIGYNYNFGINDWSWFVGVHLPFNFPGMPLQAASAYGNNAIEH